MNKQFLPTTQEEMHDRGWDACDIILVTGDAYVDHPSYGASLIGRVLENAGFKVGIIAQPDCARLDDFTSLGRPRLFFGVTAGNLDSMVAHYSANRVPRKTDDYSPGGKIGLRPDRATIVYTNKIRQAYKGMPVVIGGIEASLRRLAHYDYWSDTVKRSILLDAKADILVYGMGETQTIEIAQRLSRGDDIKTIDGIPGTVVIRNDAPQVKDALTIPSFEKISSEKGAFTEAFMACYGQSDPSRGKTLLQKHGERYIVHFPPARPLSPQELDRIYALPFVRAWHPSYDKAGGVPGFESVRFSVTSHRGCPGACNFCSLFFHQGRIVQSRSEGSVLHEIREIAARDYFKGTITDIGGPTANLYMAACASWKKGLACKDKNCITPAKCKSLSLRYDKTLKLWEQALKIPGVQHIFIGSGVRYDLLVEQYSDRFLKELCAQHISGYLKVAPEHSSGRVLALMNKPAIDTYERFVNRFNKANKDAGKKQFLVNYFIGSHPGSGLEEALELAQYLAKRGIRPEQIQDFLPLPMTVSACMYHTGKDPFTGKALYVARGMRERKKQRALMQYTQARSMDLVREALRDLKKPHLIGLFKTPKKK